MFWAIHTLSDWLKVLLALIVYKSLPQCLHVKVAALEMRPKFEDAGKDPQKLLILTQIHEFQLQMQKLQLFYAKGDHVPSMCWSEAVRFQRTGYFIMPSPILLIAFHMLWHSIFKSFDLSHVWCSIKCISPKLSFVCMRRQHTNIVNQAIEQDQKSS